MGAPLIETHEGRLWLTVQWIQTAFGLPLVPGGSPPGDEIRDYCNERSLDNPKNIIKIQRPGYERWLILIDQESATHVNAIRERLVERGHLT